MFAWLLAGAPGPRSSLRAYKYYTYTVYRYTRYIHPETTPSRKRGLLNTARRAPGTLLERWIVFSPDVLLAGVNKTARIHHPRTRKCFRANKKTRGQRALLRAVSHGIRTYYNIISVADSSYPRQRPQAKYICRPTPYINY